MTQDDAPPAPDASESAGIGKQNRSLFLALAGFVPQSTEQLLDQSADRMSRMTVELAKAMSDAVLMQKRVFVGNTMRRLSNGWRIDWQDDKGAEGGEVDDLIGFNYIAQLIGTPHISVLTVRLLGIESDPVALSDQYSVQSTWDSAATKAVSDREAELEATVTRLDNECNEAKSEGDEVAHRDSFTLREQAWDELLKLRQAKAEAIKPDGKPRELNKPNAKAHESIRKAIARAVTHCDAKNLKRLALHFDTFVKADGTGTGYVYCPDPTVTWNVEATTSIG